MFLWKQFLICNVLAGAVASGQTAAWQGFQNPTAAEVLARWKAPPAEYGPEPYYGMNGALTIEVVRRDLDTMRALGYGAVTVQYGYGASFAYLSPEYFAFFKEFVAEAKMRDMRVWIVDDAGYPSGFAGGKFSAEHPELRMQALVASRRVVQGGERVSLAANDQVVAASAISSDGTVLNVPVKMVWVAPPGEWTLAVVTHVFTTSPTRSDTNPKRVKDGSQSLEDYLDPAATTQYLAFTHEQYKKAVGDEFGKTILGFRGDEPDYSIVGLPWTPKFFARFQELKGYDVRPWLGAFAPNEHHAGQKDAPLAALTAEQLRVKADYYDVFADMFRDGFFKPQGEWCAANHLEYQVHLNHEEMQLQLTHSEGDFFRDMRYVEVPGIDSIWHQIWTDTVSDFPRLAASAAHVYGHPRAFTESFAAYRPEPDVTMARYILNEQFVRGVNLVETMYFPATSTPGRGGPAEFMRDPGYPALMAYTRRMSYLMSMGRPAANVAVLLPSASLWMGDARADDTFVSTERMLSERQVDFDVVDEDAIGVVMKAGKGTFETLSGNRFTTVIVPAASVLSQGTVDRLREFAGGGGRVLFIGGTPGWIGERSYKAGRAAAGGDFSWAKATTAGLGATPTPPAQPPAEGPGVQVVAAEIEGAVKAAVGVRELTLDRPDTGLRYLRRTLDGATVFLLFNESGKAIHNRVALRGAGRVLEVWDPQTGVEKVVAGAVVRGGVASVGVDLEGYATEVLVLRGR